MTGLLPNIMYSILVALNLESAATAVNWIFLVVPMYTMGKAFDTSYTNNKALSACTPEIIAACPFFKNPCCQGIIILFIFSNIS